MSLDEGLMLKHTNVSRPQLLHSNSKQSVTASEDYYSLEGDNRSSASDDREPTPTQQVASSPALYYGPNNEEYHPLYISTASSVKANGSLSKRTVAFEDPETQKHLRREPVGASLSRPTSRSEEDAEAGAEQKSLQSQKRGTKMNTISPPTTPGVDETPYIRFAIDQLTRDEEVRGSRHYLAPSNDADGIEEEYPVDRIVPDEGLGYLKQQQQKDRNMAMQKEIAAGPAPKHPLQNVPPLRRSSSSIPQYDVFVPYEPTSHTTQQPRLNFLPGVLRPLWLGLFILLCILVTAGLLFCAIWSRTHHGLWDYNNFGDARYFVFEYLPNILGMLVVLWLFQIQIAVQRIAPFMVLASPLATTRLRGTFLDLYPTQFLIPKLQYFRSGQPIIGAVFFVCWLFLFSIPLLASAFNVRFYGPLDTGVWRWVAVQAVIWTTIGLYILLICALMLLAVHLWRSKSGLKWDPRSIADIVALLERANIVNDYADTETFSSIGEFKQRLWNRCDRLGYWHTSRRPQDIFYGLGEEGGPTRRYSIEQGRIREKPPQGVMSHQPSIESMSGQDFEPSTPHTPHAAGDYSIRGDIRDAGVRRRYLPWFFSSSAVLAWILIVIVLLIAFYVVCFVNQASTSGFLPQLGAAADSEGFSPANFLYSFVPGFLGLLLFLLWLPIDFTNRRLAPFAAMSSPRGATAEKSLLLDYPYAFPISVSLSAASNRHWKVALLSTISLINVAIPILAGGIFWAQWYPNSLQVKIAAEPAGLYAICFFLALYALAFFALIPGRRSVALPHDARCLAEIMSWLYMSPLLIDRQFSRCATKADLVARLVPAPVGDDHSLAHKRSFWASVTNLVSGGASGKAAARDGGDIEAGPSGTARDRDDKRLSTVPEAGVPTKALSRLGTTDQHVLRQSKLDRIGGGEKLRYGFGVYLGRDGREHLGIDRIKRGGREMVLFEDGNMNRRSWIGF